MATSGSTNFTVSRNEIITAALRSINAVATGETPNSAEISEAAQALNLMIKAWDAEGIGLWLIDTGEITLVADQASYTMGSGGNVNIVRPLEIIEARFYDATAEIETPMTELSRQDYYDLPDKTSTGTPSQYYYDPQLSLGVFYIWSVWDDTASDTIRFSFKTEVEDFDAASNNPDFPKEWFRCLKFNLAIELAPEYGVVVSPTLQKLADDSKFQASAFDREKTSVFLGRERR